MALKSSKVKKNKSGINKKFKYRKRSSDDVKKRQNQSGGAFDSLVKDHVKEFRPKEGDYEFRIIPPTWKGADHYGYDVYVHYGIGPNENTYICPAKTLGKKCPVCDEKKRAETEGEEEYSKKLTAKKRVAMYIIDRRQEKEGPMLYLAPWTLDRDIAALSIHKKTGEVLAIDDPEQGYDVEFTKSGKGVATKYIGLQIGRTPTALSDSEKRMTKWVDLVVENPIPDALKIYEPEYLKDLLDGGIKAAKKKKKDEEEEEEEEDSDDDDDDDDDDEDDEPKSKKSKKKKSKKDDDDDDDDDDDEDEDEDDEDEDEPKGKKGKSKKSKKDDDEDEDDDDDSDEEESDDDDDDDDDEDEPKSKKGKSKKDKKKKSKSDDEDEDDDDDDDDSDEEESDDDDDDDDDEDEDDEPKKGKKSTKDKLRDAKKKKKK